MNLTLFILLGAITGPAQADGGHDIAVTDAGIEQGGPVDAGTEEIATYTSPLYSTCPVAPPVQVLDGGWFLMSPERNVRIACLMTTCDVDRSRREKEQAQSAAPASWVAVVGAAVSSAILTYSLTRTVK